MKPHKPVPQEPMPVVLEISGAPLINNIANRAASIVIFVLLPVAVVVYFVRPL